MGFTLPNDVETKRTTDVKLQQSNIVCLCEESDQNTAVFIYVWTISMVVSATGTKLSPDRAHVA